MDNTVIVHIFAVLVKC